MRSFGFVLTLALLGACGDDSPGGNGGSGGGGSGGSGGEGAAGGTYPPFQCEVGTLETPLCEGPSCPFSNVGRLECGDFYDFTIQVQSATDGAPTILLDPDAAAQPSWLADVSGGEVAALADIPSHATFATDEQGNPSFSYVKDGPAPWYYQELGGEAEIIGGEEVSYWVPRALAARGTARYAVGLRKEPDGPETNVLATRQAPGDWTLAELSGSDANPQLELTQDGTPMVLFNDDQGRVVVQIGDAAPEPIELAPDTQARSGFGLVPGPSSWEAAAYLDTARLALLRPSLSPATTDAYAEGELQACIGGCGGRCDETGTGVSSALNPFAVEGGFAFVFAELTVDRRGHFEQGDCDGTCPCFYVVDTDDSFIDLVLVRFDAATSEFSELGRFPIPAAGELRSIQLDTSRHDSTIAFALSFLGQVIYGQIDASAL